MIGFLKPSLGGEASIGNNGIGQRELFFQSVFSKEKFQEDGLCNCVEVKQALWWAGRTPLMELFAFLPSLHRPMDCSLENGWQGGNSD